jgi:hypothetical protein
VKYLAYTSFMAANSFMSARKTVVFTTVAEAGAGGRQERGDVVQDPRGLRGDVSRHHVARGRIQGNRPRQEQQVAGTDPGGVGADRRGCARRADGVPHHASRDLNAEPLAIEDV